MDQSTPGSVKTMPLHLNASPPFGEATEATPLIDDQAKSLHEKSTQYSEFRWILKNSIPVVGTYFLQNSLQLASVFSLGHLGSTELAAAALASMFAGVSAWSIAWGAATALDTLCSQAWTGAHDKTLVGVHLQRGLLIQSLLLVPVAVIWLNSTQLLLALNQEPELSRLAGLFMRYLLIGAPANIAFESVKKYMQAQGIMHATTFVLLIISPLNFILNYLMVHVEPFRLGFIGAPLATSISYWISLGILLLFIKYVNGWQAWGGWTRESLHGWKPFLRLALPGIFMVCSEWWIFEVAALVASYLGSIELAAQSILLTICSTFYTIPFGISVATTTRVGNAVGEGRPMKARLAAKMAIALVVMVAVFNSTMLILTRSVFGYLFTSDPLVIASVSRVLPLCAAFQIADSLTAVSGGIIRGLGRQKIGAYINLFAYYVIAAPLCFLLVFKVGWGLSGIWTSLSTALFSVATIQLFFLRTINWNEEVNRNLRRLRSLEEDYHHS